MIELVVAGLLTCVGALLLCVKIGLKLCIIRGAGKNRPYVC